MALLTNARRAVWDAIDNWAPLNNTFRRTFRFDKSESTDQPQARGEIDVPQSLQDFPALSIFPAKVQQDPEWLTNKTKVHSYGLECKILTAGWDSVAENEDLWEKIVDALFNATVEGQTVPEVRRVTLNRPEQPSPGGFRRGRVFPEDTGKIRDQTQGIPFVEHKFNVQLKLRYQAEN